MSKGLEALATGKKRTKVVATLDNGNALLSKQEVEEIAKELKALEIIKKRECIYKGLQEVTQEEYDLLKEVLS